MSKNNNENWTKSAKQPTSIEIGKAQSCFFSSFSADAAYGLCFVNHSAIIFPRIYICACSLLRLLLLLFCSLCVRIKSSLFIHLHYCVSTCILNACTDTQKPTQAHTQHTQAERERERGGDTATDSITKRTRAKRVWFSTTTTSVANYICMYRATLQTIPHW